MVRDEYYISLRTRSPTCKPTFPLTQTLLRGKVACMKMFSLSFTGLLQIHRPPTKEPTTDQQPPTRDIFSGLRIFLEVNFCL